MSFVTWNLPTGRSADSSLLYVERMKHYRFSVFNYLKNGQRVIPTIQTCRHIIESYDKFGLEVAISNGSYQIINDEDIVGNYAVDTSK